MGEHESEGESLGPVYGFAWYETGSMIMLHVRTEYTVSVDGHQGATQ